MNPHVYGKLIFNKDKLIAPTIQWGKEPYFQHMVLGQMDIYVPENEMGAQTCTICKIINSKLTKDLNVREKTVKFFQENLGVYLQDLGLGYGFLNIIPKA